MPSICLHKNPHTHSGTSQGSRVLKALHPSYAQVDERSSADLILFAKEYGRYLNYYTSASTTDGNWQPLMRMDLSVVLATLANQRIDAYLQLIRTELDFIASKDNVNVSELKKHFAFIFDFVYSWLYEIERQCQLLPDDWNYKASLIDTIRSTLAMQRYHLWRWYQQAAFDNCLSTQQIHAGIPLPFEIESTPAVKEKYWQPCWDFTPDPDLPYQPELYGSSALVKIKNTAVNNLFVGVIETIFKQSASIVQRAGESLEESFINFPRHTPHYALFLTFIQLFRYAQNELNQFTQHHLNLYYKDILQLKSLEPVGDSAHVIITLQKNISQHLITSGTAFKAGKDAAGNNIEYTAGNNTVINTAEVVKIQSLLALPKKWGSKSYQSVYAATQSNSADGLGAEIKGEDKSWKTFGPANASNLGMAGFAIASHLLYLQEGNRTITLSFEAEQALPSDSSLFTTKPQVQLTGEKGWETATVQSFAKDAANNKKFSIVCNIGPDIKAIVPFNAGIHQTVYNTAYPVIRFTWQSAAGYNSMQLWSGVQIKKADLKVEVTGLKKLNVRNDLSVLDTSKPFQPFGHTPYAGSTCIIGSKEIFQKDNAAVTLHFDWDKVPEPEGIISHMSWYKDGSPYSGNIIDIRHDTFYDFNNRVVKTKLAQLNGGAWGSLGASQNLFSSREMFGDDLVNHADNNNCGDLNDLRNRGLFDSYPEADFQDSPNQPIKFTVSAEIAPDFTADTPFDHNSKRGYIKLQLMHGLGHQDFVQRFTLLAAKQQKPPQDPYTPLAKALTADYTASLTLDFSASSASAFKSKKWQFFSIHPFGVKEEHKALNNDSDFSLAPGFASEGELFIGFDKAINNSTVQVLMQVSEGSANPLRSKQELTWSYLANNNHWKEFENGKITDDTNGLLHSGIIAFALPNDIADAPTLMGHAYKWVKASVKQFSDAICDMIEVRAQAIKLHWSNAGNKAVVFTQPTPADTIAKLVTADALIKKIEQPFDSFGGRLQETDDKFYLRSSERLRHKRRAITIWDYERLVLEAFPAIYKVKCLNHTLVRMNAQGEEMGDNELAPGHVVVVPVPDISKIKSRNPLKPLTSLDTLTQIEHYLKTITSGHVRLQVRNAVFEEVVISCHVKFIGNDPAFYHDVLLEDLKQFMCPWAYNPQSEIEFGGKISKSILINFMEERPYVDYITRFKLYLRVNNTTLPIDREEITAQTSRSILVIAPANIHTIQYLNVQC